MMISRRAHLFALLGLLLNANTVAEESCTSIADVICDAGFNAVCEALSISGLIDDLNGDLWTVFVPTDNAFEELGRDNLDSLVFGNTTVPLTDLVLFHVVPGQALTTSDLICTAGQNLVEMANGFNTRTICESEIPAYQRGPYNDKTDAPKLISSDLTACNGVVHVIDKVLLFEELPYPIPGPVSITMPESMDENSVHAEIETLFPTFMDSEGNSTSIPTETDEGCQTIAEWVCTNPNFSVSCALLSENGLVDDLSDGLWTIFAPNNEAFDNAPRFPADADIDFILQGHIVANEAIPFEDLECTEKTEMLNGKSTRTVCREGTVYQNGAGNADDQRPAIRDVDIEACNGIIHVIDQVILP